MTNNQKCVILDEKEVQKCGPQRAKQIQLFPPPFRKPSSNFLHILAESNSSICVYTVFCILNCMKDKIGMKPMLDYMDEYLKIIEFRNPSIKRSVAKAIKKVDIQAIYKEATL